MGFEECLSRSLPRRLRRDLQKICFFRLGPGQARSGTVREEEVVWRYLCWNPSQASVEDFTTYVEDHGMSGGERGEQGGW